ncbi:MAG: phage tail tube protein [Alphaproteobacteria bacterium]|nr:phage tail tube protein [Alphaproteobacteria bacterium]
MADTSRRVAGTAYFSVDGVSYSMTGEVGYSPSTYKRETVINVDGTKNYIETPIQGYIEGTFRDLAGLTVADFNAMTNVTVTLELANDKTIIGSNMWTTDPQEVNSDEAKFKVRWEGDVQEA